MSVFLTSEDGTWSVNLHTIEAVHVRENILADTNLDVERWELVAEPNSVVLAGSNEQPISAGVWLREILGDAYNDGAEAFERFDFGQD